MKYALISEEQIRQLSFHVQHLKQVDPVSFSHASLIMKSLKPSEPVAYMQDSIEFYASEQQTPTFNKPLFALEKSE